MKAAVARTWTGSTQQRPAPWLALLVTAAMVFASGLVMVLAVQTYTDRQVDAAVTITTSLHWRAGPGFVLPTDRPWPDKIEARNRAIQQLERNPYDVQALTTLAAHAGQSADRTSQSRLVHQLSRITRRSTAGEAWLFQEGLESARYDEAVRSLDLLARRKAGVGSLLAFELSAVMDRQGAREALSRVLLEGPVWGPSLLRQLSRSAPLESMDALLVEMASRGRLLDDASMEPVLRRHLAEGDYPGARRLWAQIYPPDASRNRVYDGGFDGLPGPPPFNWQIVPPRGGPARWKPDPGQRPGFLAARHDLYGSSAPLISQLLFLAAGPYELSVSARSVSGQAHRRFRLDILCFEGPELLSQSLTMAPGAWGVTASRFVVPGQDCGLQTIRVRPVTGDRPQPVEVQLDEIVILPAGARPGLQVNRGVP